MEINLNEEDIDIKEDDTNPEDENVGFIKINFVLQMVDMTSMV